MGIKVNPDAGILCGGCSVDSGDRGPDGMEYCAQTMTASQFVPARWPMDDLTYFVDPSGQSVMPAAEVLKAFETALQAYSDRFVLSFTRVMNPRDANIAIRFGRIDGPSGVLAQSHVADGTRRQKQQTYDLERWVDSDRPGRGQIDLGRVIEHEWGHVMGLLHFTPPVGGLMDPSYSLDVPTLTDKDIAAMVKLGYVLRERQRPIPPANPGQGAGAELLFNTETKVIYAPEPWTLKRR